MTFILNETYGFTIKGVKSYLQNRFLRIYPVYWLIMAASIIVIAAFPVTSKTFKDTMEIPSNALDWIYNLIIFGLGNTFFLELGRVRIIPPAWTLHIEFLFYILIPILAKTYKRTLLWFSLSLLYTVLVLAFDMPWGTRYRPLQAASLPFSIGALLFYVLNRSENGLKFDFNAKIFFGLLLGYICNLIFAESLGDPRLVSFYINLLFLTVIVAFLSRVPVEKVPKALLKIDQFLGDLSYPVYLIHWLIGLLVILLIFQGMIPPRYSHQGGILFFISFPFINIFAALIHRMMEKPLGGLRDRIRGKSIDKFMEKAS